MKAKVPFLVSVCLTAAWIILGIFGQAYAAIRNGVLGLHGMELTEIVHGRLVEVWFGVTFALMAIDAVLGIVAFAFYVRNGGDW